MIELKYIVAIILLPISIKYYMVTLSYAGKLTRGGMTMSDQKGLTLILAPPFLMYYLLFTNEFGVAVSPIFLIWMLIGYYSADYLNKQLAVED